MNNQRGTIKYQPHNSLPPKKANTSNPSSEQFPEFICFASFSSLLLFHARRFSAGAFVRRALSPALLFTYELLFHFAYANVDQSGERVQLKIPRILFEKRHFDVSFPRFADSIHSARVCDWSRLLSGTANARAQRRIKLQISPKKRNESGKEGKPFRSKRSNDVMR